MPTAANSHSPRRKRIRRYFSASGSRWSGKGTSTPPNIRKRRDSSTSSTGRLTFSAGFASERSDAEPFEDTASFTSQAERKTYPVLPPLDRPPLTYASLPPTPILSSPHPRDDSPPLTSPPYTTTFDRQKPSELGNTPPFSLWDYLREELLATDFDSHQELKWERVSNFLSMPVAIEKVKLSLNSIKILIKILNRSCSLALPCALTLSSIISPFFPSASSLRPGGYF